MSKIEERRVRASRSADGSALYEGEKVFNQGLRTSKGDIQIIGEVVSLTLRTLYTSGREPCLCNRPTLLQ